MLKQEITSILILLAVLLRPMGGNGEKNTLCYIKKNNTTTVLCVPPSTVTCCNQRISVDGIYIYGNKTCNTGTKCKSGAGCCQSRNILIVPAEYEVALKQIFRDTDCFNNVTISQLPKNDGLVSVVVSYSCTDSKTNVAAAVIVPIVIGFIVAAVVAVVFLIRRRRSEKKESVQSGVEPTTFNGPLQKPTPYNRQDSALPSPYDVGVNSEYAEIGGNRNSNLFGESNEYNTISLRTLPVTNGQISAGQQATNSDYDHIGVQSPADSKRTDTYTHIDHSAANRLNVSNGGVITGMSMYAHAAHNAKPRHGANTVDVGGDTYAHVDHSGKQRQTDNSRFNAGDTYAHANHGALQEHGGNGISNTYDSTSTSGVHQEGRYTSEESQYDHTDHNAPRVGLGQYQDGGDYSHVGSLSASQQREDDHVTNGNRNQRLVSGTKKQNDQNSDQHSYFVLEKQFK